MASLMMFDLGMPRAMDARASLSISGNASRIGIGLVPCTPQCIPLVTGACLLKILIFFIAFIPLRYTILTMAETKPIPLRLSVELLNSLDRAVKQLGFETRADVIRICLITFLNYIEREGFPEMLHWKAMLRAMDGRTRDSVFVNGSVQQVVIGSRGVQQARIEYPERGEDSGKALRVAEGRGKAKTGRAKR